MITIINPATKEQKTVKSLIVQFSVQKDRFSEGTLFNEEIQIEDSVLAEILTKSGEWVNAETFDNWLYPEYKYRVVATSTQIKKILKSAFPLVAGIFEGKVNDSEDFGDIEVIYINKFDGDSRSFIENTIGCKVEENPNFINVEIV